MRRTTFTLFFVLLTCCSCKDQKPPPPAAPAPSPATPDAQQPGEPAAEKDPLALFHASLDLEAPSGYSEILASSKQDPDRPAPPALRSLIMGLEPPRFEMTTVVEDREGWITYVWFMPSFTLRGSPEDALQKLRKVLAAHAFEAEDPVQNRHGETEHHFRKTAKGISHHLWLTGPFPHQGGTEERCSGTLLYEIASPTKLPSPTVQRMLEVYPRMDCTEVPDEIMQLAAPLHFTRMSCGGTWKDHYNFSVTVPPDDDGNSREQVFLDAAADLGFTSFKDEPGNKILEHDEKTSAFVYITTDEDRHVTVRVQPGQ